MASEELVKHVVSLLLDLDETQLSRDLPLNEVPGWDSVNALRVLVYLEQEVGHKLDYERFMAAERLGDLWFAPSARPGAMVS